MSAVETCRHRKPVWADDVPNDPRFVSALFRRFPHQSGILVPLVLDHEPAGLFYLVWWHERRRPDAAELATLQALGRQAGRSCGGPASLARSSAVTRGSSTCPWPSSGWWTRGHAPWR